MICFIFNLRDPITAKKHFVSSFRFGFAVYSTGLLLDKCGVRFTIAFGLGLWTVGLILLVLGTSGVAVNVDYGLDAKALSRQSSSISESAIFFTGFCFVGAASVATLHPIYSVGNLFGSRRNAIVTTINGFADSSAVVFLLLRILFFSASIALYKLLIGYLLGPILICFLFVAFLWPIRPYKSKEEIVVKSKGRRNRSGRRSQSLSGELYKARSFASISTEEGGIVIEGTDTSSPEQEPEERPSSLNIRAPDHGHGDEGLSGPHSANGSTGAKDLVELRYPHLGKTFKEQVKTYRFIGGAVFTCINILKFNYFFVSLNEVLKNMGDSHGTYTQIFGWISLAGVGVVFVTGTIIDKYGLIGGFWGSNISGLLLSVLSLIPILELQILTFLVFVIFRSFLFSVAATFFSTEFGFDNFGKLMGSTLCLAGGVGFLSQPLFILGVEEFNRDFTVPGLILLALTLVQMIIPALYHYDRSMRVKRVTSPGFEGYISPYVGRTPV